MTKKIGIIIPYFGKWPPWIDYFFQSCIHNQTIDWLFPTDCAKPPINEQNLKFIPFKLSDFNKRISSILGMSTEVKYPYKICDYKPAYGEIFSDLLTPYDFWGYGDLDLVYGNISDFFKDSILNEFDIISNHPDFITGHFCLLKNTPRINALYKLGGAYKYAFAEPHYTGFDEQIKRVKINPDPKYLSSENIKDRRKHIARHRVFQNVKKLFHLKLNRTKNKKEAEILKDFTSIVMRSVSKKEIKLFQSKTFESDLMNLKLKKENWKITWKNGLLKNDLDKNLLYFHFMLSKDDESFQVSRYIQGIKEFSITPSGINGVTK